MHFKFVTVFMVMFLSIVHTSHGLAEIKSEEYSLYNKLFENYSKSVRPVKNWSDKINLKINVDLKKISSVIENHQTVTIYVRLELVNKRWTDALLVWNPNDYNKIESIVLPAEKIWIPDLHLFNSAAEDDRIYPVNVELFSNGTVQAYPINQLYAHCDFNFARFPYDTQDCDFIIGTMINKKNMEIALNINADTNKIVPNSEWKFKSFTHNPSWNNIIPGSSSDPRDSFSSDWSVVKFTLKIERSSSFYVNLFVWPLIFILFITMSTFILPPSCVERVTMGVLLLLTLVIMSLMLESYTPKSSTEISIIGKLLGFTMFMVTWSTFVSTLIIGIDKDNFSIRTIPIWLKNIMLNYIGKITCKQETIMAKFTANPLNREEEIEILDTNQIMQISQTTNSIATESNNEASNESTLAKADKVTSLDINQAKTLLSLISNQLAILRLKLQEQDLKDQNKRDWLLVAIILDRFCIFIYLIIMLIGIFIIFI